jgi:hypothetical protein
MDPIGDFRIPLYLPPEFIVFVNDLVSDALKDHGLAHDKPILTPVSMNQSVKLANNTLEVVYWHIDPILAWQQIDRRIDEYA